MSELCGNPKFLSRNGAGNSTYCARNNKKIANIAET